MKTYMRPTEVSNPPGRRYYANEVFASEDEVIKCAVGDVLQQCCIMDCASWKAGTACSPGGKGSRQRSRLQWETRDSQAVALPRRACLACPVATHQTFLSVAGRPLEFKYEDIFVCEYMCKRNTSTTQPAREEQW